MNSKNIVAIKKEKILCTCMKCLKEGKKEDMHVIHIPQMGYGSGFDGFDTLIILCDDCYKESTKDIPDLWSMKEKTRKVVYKKNDYLIQEERDANKTFSITSSNDYLVPIDMQNDVIHTEDSEDHFDEYKYENEMFAYIASLPLESQELVNNRLDTGCFAHKSDPQDWIDYCLDELSYEKCKENHWVFNGEYDSYKEKFEKCDHVINVVYKDGSKCSKCLIDLVVRGNFGGKCQDGGRGCYNCKYFKERNGEIRTIEHKDNKGLNGRSNIDELSIKEKFEAGYKLEKATERLMIINTFDGKNFEECVVIRREGDRYLVVNREDFKDVLHERKFAKDIFIKWITSICYFDYIGTLVDEREIVIANIEKNAKII